MKALEPSKLAAWCGGAWSGGKPERVAGFSNDTRTLAPGEVFVALATGARDGHDFIAQAKAKGASAALVQRVSPEAGLPQLLVADVSKALLDMAAAYRKSWDMPVVGVTGSAGKTTCKDALAALLGEGRVLATRGNFNNLIGLPLSVLRPLSPEIHYGVFEAGISEPGEMERLARVIEPEVAIFTSIGPSHLEKLGDVDTVAREKGKLARSERTRLIFGGETCEPFESRLGGGAVAIVREDAGARRDWRYRLAFEENGSRIDLQVFGELERYRFAAAGRGVATSVALALAAARSLGVSSESAAERLARWRPSRLRGQWIDRGAQRAYLDCYNANPLSMRDALEAFIVMSRGTRPRMFVIGCMEELGEASPFFHEELGKSFPLRAQDFLLVIGEQKGSVLEGMRKAGKSLNHCEGIETIDEARGRVASFEGDVFLKGSRKYRLEEALSGAEAAASQEGPRC